MAKTKGTGSRYAGSTRETGSDLSFVGKAIDDAVAAIERRRESLPSAPPAERRVLRSAVLALKLTAKATQLHCGPRWFFLPK